MSEVPLFPPPAGLLPTSNRQYRSTSGSPTRQRATDELLSSLTPSTALEAFRNPSGALKACLDLASATEQAFAMGAALASKNIYDWLTELSGWIWSSDRDGSAGFESPVPRGQRRAESSDTQASIDEPSTDRDSVVGDDEYLGCLRVTQVAQYEERLVTIQSELDDLDIEGIKRHVLHNHILPLSRPGTPLSARSTYSSAGPNPVVYNKLDDMTALMTATVVQALPNLSRLVRLMRTWRVRLLVLRRVPLTLSLLDEAEVALQSGWNAIEAGRRKSAVLLAAAGGASYQLPTPALLRRDFEVMNSVLGQRVAQAAQAIDFMLDQLDGRPETVPPQWIQRMDQLEKGYGDWVAVCEKTMRDTDWVKNARRSLQAEQGLPDPCVREQHVSTDAGEENKASKNQTDSPQLLPGLQPRKPKTLAAAAEISPPISPPSMARNQRARSMSFSEIPPVQEEDESILEGTPPKSPLESSFLEEDEFETTKKEADDRMGGADELQRKISSILNSIPAKIHLSSQPSPVNHLNPPDLQLPHLNTKSSRNFDRYSTPRAQSRSQSAMSSRSSRAGTPSFLLAPAFARNTKSRMQREIQVYHLSRESTGEAPIKLFIRLVGENGDRCMVRVGGGWADLGEYLKEYAIHHGRRSKAGGANKVEVKDVPTSSPASRPASALDSPITPLHVRKTRRSFGGLEDSASSTSRHAQLPKTPLSALSVDVAAQVDNQGHRHNMTPPSEASTRSRSSSRLSWVEEDSLLGMSGPTGKQIELDAEKKEWIENVKEKVRIASGERRLPPTSGGSPGETFFGEISKVGGTKRLFRRGK